jgi:isopenicillin-N epimerase
VTSHGANDPRVDRSRYRLESDWTGTVDPSPWLAIPDALRFVASLHPDGWAGVMAANRALVLAARDRLAAALGVAAPAPDGMLGAMAALPLPGLAGASDAAAEAVQADLLARGFEVPVIGWPVRAARDEPDRPVATLIRVSAQRYDTLEEYQRLAVELVAALDGGGRAQPAAGSSVSPPQA